jgi:alpha-glutamyl/putrescinyl thymine pyrophosphorylase clade 1
MIPTPVLETYWRFAAERQAIYFRRFAEPGGPWTCDPILQSYRFTNSYRATDRVSQHLIRDVQYGPGRSQAPRELFFRTLLFKIFNRIETWQAIEDALGPVSYDGVNLEKISGVLNDMLNNGQRIYSAAYIMPSPNLGHARKHANHLALIARMMNDKLPDRIAQAPTLAVIYEMLLRYPGIGPFLAFQYTIDLNYSAFLDFDESSFVVAGPGALDGIAKCFSDIGRLTPEEVIYAVTDDQESAFHRARLEFQTLFGRRLQPIDCQNLFCEVSKYARIAHPKVTGTSERKRIKQVYRPREVVCPAPFLPPRWGVKVMLPGRSVI